LRTPRCTISGTGFATLTSNRRIFASSAFGFWPASSGSPAEPPSPIPV
jgi:hypothetical protein